MPLPSLSLEPGYPLEPGYDLEPEGGAIQLSNFARVLYAELEPFQYAELDHAHALQRYCSAIAAPFDEIWDMVMVPETPWQDLMNLDVTPEKFVAWLGLFKGIRSIQGIADALRRNLVREAAGFDRGKITSMRAAMKATLTGSQHLELTERYTGSAWKMHATVYAAEVPNVQKLLNAIAATKPGGIVLILVIADSETWNEAKANPTPTNWNDADPGMTWDEALTGI